MTKATAYVNSRPDPFSFKPRHRLDVRGVGKQIERTECHQIVAARHEARAVAREGRRIAGHIDEPRRSEADHPVERRRRDASARRVQHDRVETILADLPQRILDRRSDRPEPLTERLRVRDQVTAADPVAFDGDDVMATRGERDREQSDARVEVSDVLATPSSTALASAPTRKRFA